MPDLQAFSPSRLHRLLPSDVAEIAKSLQQPDGEASILRAFVNYLALLKNPSAVELDDVTRIALQLASTGIWEKTPPDVFISDARSRVDKDVLAPFVGRFGCRTNNKFGADARPSLFFLT
jgi:hypothetical protein